MMVVMDEQGIGFMSLRSCLREVTPSKDVQERRLATSTITADDEFSRYRYVVTAAKSHHLN